MDFKHYILTRYNEGLYTDNIYKVEDTDLYMECRLPWFKRLLKSLDNQTNQNFTHVVSLDPNTPEEHLKEILNAVYMAKTNSVFCYEKHLTWLRRQSYDADYLITSRIDNDDEYYPEFIEVIQRNFRPDRYVLDVVGHEKRKDSTKVVKAPRNNSSFVTMVEPWTEGFKSIFTGGGHSRLPMYFKCEQVDTDQPLFIRNIHGTNVYFK